MGRVQSWEEQEAQGQGTSWTQDPLVSWGSAGINFFLPCADFPHKAGCEGATLFSSAPTPCQGPPGPTPGFLQHTASSTGASRSVASMPTPQCTLALSSSASLLSWEAARGGEPLLDWGPRTESGSPAAHHFADGLGLLGELVGVHLLGLQDPAVHLLPLHLLLAASEW